MQEKTIGRLDKDADNIAKAISSVLLYDVYIKKEDNRYCLYIKDKKEHMLGDLVVTENGFSLLLNNEALLTLHESVPTAPFDVGVDIRTLLILSHRSYDLMRLAHHQLESILKKVKNALKDLGIFEVGEHVIREPVSVIEVRYVE